MGEEQRSKSKLIKCIGDPVPGLVILGPVADATLPQRDGLSHANHNQHKPSGEQEGEELGRLDVGEQRILRVINRIEAFINALILILHLVERNVICHEIVRIVS